jgi:hypothetical protein
MSDSYFPDSGGSDDDGSSHSGPEETPPASNQEQAQQSAIDVLKTEDSDWREDWDMDEFRSLPVEEQWDLVESHDGETRHPMGQFLICGAKRRKTEGGPCLHKAGKGTDHVGQGYCFLHTGAIPTMHSGTGRYADVDRESTTELIQRFRDDDAPLDIQDELAVMRSLIVEYINEYDELVAALKHWNKVELEEKGEAARPQKVPHIDRALEMLEKVANVAQKQQKLEQDDAISRRQLLRIMTHMGRVVDDLVTDAEVKEQIMEEWRNIYV